MVKSSLWKWTSACTSPATDPPQISPRGQHCGETILGPQGGLVKNLLMIWRAEDSFPADTAGADQTYSRDHLDPTWSQAFIIATGEKKIKQQSRQKAVTRWGRSTNKPLVVFLLLMSEKCWRMSTTSATTSSGGLALQPPLPYVLQSTDTTASSRLLAGIVCPSSNCKIWHLVLCVQRVKLCPIKIKISTFIIL